MSVLGGAGPEPTCGAGASGRAAPALGKRARIWNLLTEVWDQPCPGTSPPAGRHPSPVSTKDLHPAPATEGGRCPRVQGRVRGLCGKERATCDRKRPWPTYGLTPGNSHLLV